MGGTEGAARQSHGGATPGGSLCVVGPRAGGWLLARATGRAPRHAALAPYPLCRPLPGRWSAGLAGPCCGVSTTAGFGRAAARRRARPPARPPARLPAGPPPTVPPGVNVTVTRGAGATQRPSRPGRGRQPRESPAPRPTRAAAWPTGTVSGVQYQSAEGGGGGKTQRSSHLEAAQSLASRNFPRLTSARRVFTRCPRDG